MFIICTRQGVNGCCARLSHAFRLSTRRLSNRCLYSCALLSTPSHFTRCWSQLHPQRFWYPISVKVGEEKYASYDCHSRCHEGSSPSGEQFYGKAEQCIGHYDACACHRRGCQLGFWSPYETFAHNTARTSTIQRASNFIFTHASFKSSETVLPHVDSDAFVR